MLKIIDRRLSGLVLVRQLFVISHSFATSHYPRSSQTFDFPCSSFGTTGIFNIRSYPVTIQGRCQRAKRATLRTDNDVIIQYQSARPSHFLEFVSCQGGHNTRRRLTDSRLIYLTPRSAQHTTVEIRRRNQKQSLSFYVRKLRLYYIPTNKLVYVDMLDQIRIS